MLKYVELKELNRIIDSREPEGVFWSVDRDNDMYIMLDNRDGEAWTEEFYNLETGLCWLEDNNSKRAKLEHQRIITEKKKAASRIKVSAVIIKDQQPIIIKTNLAQAAKIVEDIEIIYF